MVQIKSLVFNPFQVNTYILWDDTGECMIIDPACYEPDEEEILADSIEKAGLKPIALLYTHCHIDHILGNNFAVRHFDLKPLAHRDSLPFMTSSRSYAINYGFEVEDPILPEKYLKDGQEIGFGHQKLKALHTPGHAAGSLCFYHEEEGFVIVGDVLFQQSIGRTDLPTGDFDLLIRSIQEKLLTLPDEVKVFPGHGPSTTIGEERRHNPFLNGGY
ncbi:MAG: MBL fold metallo-hydrolase [Bacteroidales bacterium]|jgi:glyoxylase-like metal-dependent hydrolase (beta-lactamase superfamily II)|nr:MBL fold metallo-hydrolase [Bacteroidales bacterium]NLM92336.1 MBL fold metallo-hydrolase [Bacteroidales bacterium]